MYLTTSDTYNYRIIDSSIEVCIYYEVCGVSFYCVQDQAIYTTGSSYRPLTFLQFNRESCLGNTAYNIIQKRLGLPKMYDCQVIISSLIV